MPHNGDQYSVESHFQSITQELEALRDRVRRLITDKHWATDGEWKESVLSMALERHLPSTVRIGRGFIKGDFQLSPQCDILLYRADAPVLFRDGPLVVVTPDAVVGVIEVKTDLDLTGFKEAFDKLLEIRLMLPARTDRKHLFGLFSYKTTVAPVSAGLHKFLQSKNDLLNRSAFVCLGCDLFAMWWEKNPRSNAGSYRQWHVYELDRMAAGYFVANVVSAVSPESVDRNMRHWFPMFSKEEYRIQHLIKESEPESPASRAPSRKRSH